MKSKDQAKRTKSVKVTVLVERKAVKTIRAYTIIKREERKNTISIPVVTVYRKDEGKRKNTISIPVVTVYRKDEGKRKNTISIPIYYKKAEEEEKSEK